MNGKEFLKAVDLVVKEKHIDKEVIFEAMRNALTSAYKKNAKSKNNNVKVLINENNGDIKVYSYLTVVPDDKMTKEEYEDALFERYAEDDDLDTEISEKEFKEEEKAKEKEEDDKEKISFFNPGTEIKLSDARKIDKTVNVGDTIDTEVTPKDFGRVAASTAKQVVIQKIREAERSSITDEFGDKQDELLVGTVALEDTDNYFIDLGRTNGILPKKDIIPGEKIKMGSQIKVYVTKVDNNGRSLLVLLSRRHYGFVKRLFESEIPELVDGTVLLYSVAREAGVRSKVAVYSENPKVDPIGACIGERGSRIASIITELNGEKVDIVKYDSDPAVFIANALSPAKDLTVLITDPKKREALVIADGDNFSLAIGKKGLNAKLATRLTKYKIDIKTSEQAKEMGISIKSEE
ncbi:MAG TPA: transcription termination/antitermination protein NusA [Candidatus Onthousia excrementipullorum]|uniref:Transcription termination/antitermination protein NusA n=1 Tax=Candidatus Onthousia excrementipullorum TaxID=2840884 RepID=A0A9D1DT51_9FIRM|nr:transcription termination/antitermination protein NusA [Candidatus Onthousia excrementipullorum]